MCSLKKGQIIVIVAPSGSGKSTLIAKLKKDFKALVESVSSTTRPPRSGESEGEHYFFVSEKNFLESRDKGDFLEWACVHGNYYGTSKSFVEKELAGGTQLLFDLDVQGADSFKDYFGKRCQAIFIAPPSLSILEERLRARGTDKQEAIELRIQNSKEEILRKDDFDYLVINDNLEQAYKELSEIVRDILEA